MKITKKTLIKLSTSNRKTDFRWEIPIMPTFGVTEELPAPDQPRRNSNLRKELPFPARSLKILLEWVYTDEMPSELSKTEDVELVCQVWSLKRL